MQEHVIVSVRCLLRARPETDSSTSEATLQVSGGNEGESHSAEGQLKRNIAAERSVVSQNGSAHESPPGIFRAIQPSHQDCAMAAAQRGMPCEKCQPRNSGRLIVVHVETQQTGAEIW